MNPATVTLLRDAAEWRLISLLFESPGPGWLDQLAAVAAEVPDTALRAAVRAAPDEATATLYHSTFGPGGPAAPREVSYRGRILPGQLLGELGAYYQAFAYQPANVEPPDHVTVEAGFVAYLRLKEAYARARGDADQARVVADAARQFVADHLNALAEPLANSLAASGISYLAQAAAALLRRVGPRRADPVAAAAPAGADCAGSAGCPWADEQP